MIPSFPKYSRAQKPSEITKNSSHGVIFIIILCQTVVLNLHYGGLSLKTSHDIAQVLSHVKLFEKRPTQELLHGMPLRTSGCPGSTTSSRRLHKNFRNRYRIVPKSGVNMCVRCIDRLPQIRAKGSGFSVFSSSQDSLVEVSKQDVAVKIIEHQKGPKSIRPCR